jgi:hypothetical protein
MNALPVLLNLTSIAQPERRLRSSNNPFEVRRQTVAPSVLAHTTANWPSNEYPILETPVPDGVLERSSNEGSPGAASGAGRNTIGEAVGTGPGVETTSRRRLGLGLGAGVGVGVELELGVGAADTTGVGVGDALNPL